MNQQNNKDRFPLSEVIEQLRKELAEAVTKSEGKDLRFKVNEIEVELKTVIEQGSSGEAGINFSVLKFGGDVSNTNSDTQTVKLKLEPLTISNETGEENSVKITAPAPRIPSNG